MKKKLTKPNSKSFETYSPTFICYFELKLFM